MRPRTIARLALVLLLLGTLLALQTLYGHLAKAQRRGALSTEEPETKVIFVLPGYEEALKVQEEARRRAKTQRGAQRDSAAGEPAADESEASPESPRREPQSAPPAPPDGEGGAGRS